MADFRDARLKLKRANEHIADAKLKILTIVGPDGQASWVEFNAQHNVQVIHYRLKNLSKLPDVALIVGDAIHNLKTVLDYAWLNTITILAPGGVSDFAKFPVYPSFKGLEAALKSKRLDILAPRLFQLMLDDIKSYQGGDFSIWAIHKLDIMDKHRLLIPATNYGSVEGLKLKDDRGYVHNSGSWGSELGDQFTIAIAPNVTIEDNGRLAVKILFKEGPTKALELAEALGIFSYTVTEILKLFEGFVEIGS